MPVTIWHNPACGTSRNVLAVLDDPLPADFRTEDGKPVILP